MAKVPIFSSLSLEEMAPIAEIITDKEYKKGESIYLSGETGKRLYVINQGKIKIFRKYRKSEKRKLSVGTLLFSWLITAIAPPINKIVLSRL